MLSRLRLNAGSWLIHTQSTKPFNAASYCATSSHTRITTMLKITAPISGIGHKCVTENGLTGGGTLPLQGTLFQPACGVIKWPPNGYLSFSTSQSAENKVKRSGRSIGGNKISSAIDTSKRGQTICHEVKGTVKAKSKHTLGNDRVDIKRKNKIAHADFGKNDSELVTASDKQQANGSYSSNLNKGEKPQKNKLTTKKIVEKPLAIYNDQQAQDPVKETDVCNKLQTNSSPKKKIARLKQINLNIQKKDTKASAKLETKSSAKAEVDKAAQLEKKKLKTQKTDKKDLAKQSKASNGKVVVVVESETKAKTIQKYLGDKYLVVASYGHVRDLAPRSGSVRPNEDFIMIWEVPSAAWTHIKRIEGALTGARSLVLASDPDREGEAIAWHICEVLKQQGSLKKNVLVQRVVFHEVTASAIKNAMESPRDIDMSLVHARHARSALDYLIGFNISPLLWRKLPGCQSAGRVQSAALSLICDQEKEIEKFIPQEYWTVEAKACTQELPHSGLNSAVLAKVTHRDGKKLGKFSLNKKALADNIVQKVSSSSFRVSDVERSTKRSNPPPPYITSTLQRDSANKLKFSATKTMSLAQKLYEGVEISDNEVSGLITYMRTDGLRISEEAAENIRSLVTECYGEEYAVKSIRKFSKKVKNAQEAHEAIRPTDIRRSPSMLATKLEKDLLKLYTLIWCQAMACQMSEARINQISASFENEDRSVILRSSGSTVSFPGYLAVSQDNATFLTNDEEIEQNEEDNNFSCLSEIKDNELIENVEEKQKMENDYYVYLSDLKNWDLIYMKDVQSMQHVTQPPPRYSEGSLIEKLEGLGIGRPSTYASTIKTLQAREYITISSRRIFPEFRGRMVSKFLSHFFPEIINYSFTAYMESQLDDVSTGSIDWKNVLSKFWESFHPVCERVSKVGNNEVQNMLTQSFEDYLFGTDRKKSRTCPACKTGTLTLKATRHGAGYFVGCNRFPECPYIEATSLSEEDKPNSKEEIVPSFEPKLLGTDVKSNMQVFLKCGPYGHYVQLGEDTKGWKPKRASVSKIKAENIDLDNALELLRYPIILGNHPEDKKPVTLALMKYGFAIKYRHLIATVPKIDGIVVMFQIMYEIMALGQVQIW
ncbi:uncharacterized protein LOC131049755 isoform X2 [Cryptomeria japonica]|uniref:uncharacterized protein LOC131049755 isoform X2 n=1 Tax=Cryptomeria japonica TaxID=3369 RepID=UPI0025ACFF84|nr:uncharacterized protein LOC131049755 isoform X2 [Cryptomeria japonica]